ncbi:MAG: galactose-1-phosphate uridylyltransferase [Candidatus Omnitrophica bacterium]|nr:galactose-1-phosphate uridylyltransferase [Candidatus Omnitrophota bacterium]MBU2044365.1 galactose-1-phosphate uridylyltransferase [Candidatus Omnitrophota bacterium]MBU2473790.1 galactose-1-phosphate uridylyltransferase [Candidatus Omnitrophota bacterium]
MGELRLDPITARWVIISTEKNFGPDNYQVEKLDTEEGICPFCEGKEKMTPPEVDADRAKDSKPDTPGWQTRTVPNKYPALANQAQMNKSGVGMFDMMSGVGDHEVIVETPDHSKQLADLTIEQIKRIIRVYKRRSLALSQDERFKYVLIFKNYGLVAGASLEHSHTQLISLPVVPRRVTEELECFNRYFDYKERCIFCDIVRQEMEYRHREVCENRDFIAFCPFASRSPFEISIVPKKHQAQFMDISEDIIDNFALILKEVLVRVKKTLNNPPYNFIIHTSPVNSAQQEQYHWHVEIMPKLTKIAGFEWGTGFYINNTSPEVASSYLKKVEVQDY